MCQLSSLKTMLSLEHVMDFYIRNLPHLKNSRRFHSVMHISTGMESVIEITGCSCPMFAMCNTGRENGARS